MHTYSQFLTDAQIKELAFEHLASSGIRRYHRSTQKVLQESKILDCLAGLAKDAWEQKIKSRLEFLLFKFESEKEFDDSEFSVLYLALVKSQSSFAEDIKQKIFNLNFPSRELIWMKAEIRWIDEGEK
jgi:hypothetical protein